MITAVTAITITAALSYENMRFKDQIATEGVAHLARVSAQAAANNLSGPLNFGSFGKMQLELLQLSDSASGFVSLAYVVNLSGETVAPDLFVGNPIEPTLVTQALRTGQEQVSANGLIRATPIMYGQDTPIGALVTVWTPDQILAAIRVKRLTNILVSVGLLTVLLVISGAILNITLKRPMTRLQSAVKRVSDGDYETEIHRGNPHNEVGLFAEHLDQMRRNLSDGRKRRDIALIKHQQEQKVMQDLRQSLKILASGNLTTRITQNLPEGYAELAQDFNNTASAFHDAMRNVILLAERIRAESSDIGRHSEDLSKRTEHQAATLEETAAALDHLTNGMRIAADNTREVESIVSAARTEAAKSGEIVQKTITAMSQIEGSSSQISAIISVIDDISFQTNLLALNAGVEAARAGDAGRGFAVVASEVRALAQRSSEAAQQIKGLITGSSLHVSHGVRLVAEAGTALTAITDRVVQIASLMSEMATIVHEQSTNLHEINIGVGNLDQVTQRNAGMVEEANAASQTLLGQSRALSNLVKDFNIGRDYETPLLLDQRVA